MLSDERSARHLTACLTNEQLEIGIASAFYLTRVLHVLGYSAMIKGSVQALD
jgi:hypothetical protein